MTDWYDRQLLKFLEWTERKFPVTENNAMQWVLGMLLVGGAGMFGLVALFHYLR